MLFLSLIPALHYLSPYPPKKVLKEFRPRVNTLYLSKNLFDIDKQTHSLEFGLSVLYLFDGTVNDHQLCFIIALLDKVGDRFVEERDIAILWMASVGDISTGRNKIEHVVSDNK
ncbi:hypothetical protein ACOME3_006664 [Neoechinorhynchus agilis]